MGQDRKRFAELLARFETNTAPATRISIPFLHRELRAKGKQQDAGALATLRPGMVGPRHDDRIVTGDEVDAFEDEVIAACPRLERGLVRDNSYANLLYKHVRCGVVHEFQLSDEATATPMTSGAAPVSYSNLLRMDRTVPPTSIHEGGFRMGTVLRQIHFSLDWLAALARAAALALDEAEGGPPLREPTTWWLDGG